MGKIIDAEILKKELLSLYENKKYQKAVDKFKEYDNFTGEEVYIGVLYSIVGDCYNELRYYDEAIKNYDKTINSNVHDELTYYNRGNAYLEKGDYRKAIKDYDEAIKNNPKYACAYNKRGLAYDKRGSYEKAIQDYTQAININPKYAYAYNNIGLVYNEKGDYDKAIENYKKAIDSNRNNSFFWNNLYDTYEKISNSKTYDDEKSVWEEFKKYLDDIQQSYLDNSNYINNYDRVNEKILSYEIERNRNIETKDYNKIIDKLEDDEKKNKYRVIIFICLIMWSIYIVSINIKII